MTRPGGTTHTIRRICKRHSVRSTAGSRRNASRYHRLDVKLAGSRTQTGRLVTPNTSRHQQRSVQMLNHEDPFQAFLLGPVRLGIADARVQRDILRHGLVGVEPDGTVTCRSR